MEFSEFILAHDGDDLGALALARDQFAGEVADFDLALTTLEVRRKLRDKVPEWYAMRSLQFPLRLSVEQCSSAATARYKASVALSAVHNLNSIRAKTRLSARIQSADEFNLCENPLSRPVSLADLTGGLGVDSWAFSQLFDQVLYNEMRPELARAAVHNYRELGADSILVRNFALVPGSPSSDIPGEADVAHILSDFTPDILYLDPARRSSDGRKVYRLEDCQPDVLQLLPELLEASPLLLLKLSPMADISLVCRQLACVKEVHVVASEGECKELLLLLERGYDGPYSITLFESGAVLALPEGRTDIPPSVTALGPALSGQMSLGVLKGRETMLFEPGKALLKAGAFDLPCRYGLEKLGRHTHLYLGEQIPEALRPFGKVFRVQEVLPLNNKNIKEICKRYERAEVTARNLPLTSDQLRAKLGVRSGGSVHIFGVHIDALKAHYLLVCTL